MRTMESGNKTYIQTRILTSLNNCRVTSHTN
jgi:hypothetical protein